MSQMSHALIAPKPFSEFSPTEYHDYVKGLYFKPIDKNAAPVPGLSVCRTKKGSLSIRKSKEKRAFDYVLESEIKLMSEHYGIDLAELRETFTIRKFIIAENRLLAERSYSQKGKT